VDVGTITTALLVIGAFALFLVLMRRLPPAEDDVATVVTAVLGTPIEPERLAADLEEPVPWRLDLLSTPTSRLPPVDRPHLDLLRDTLERHHAWL
jgi:hypothetical protein